MKTQEQTWDLSTIYSSIDEFYHDLSQATELLTKLSSKKDTYLSSSDQFYDFIDQQNTFERLISKLYCYSHLHVDVDPKDQQMQLANASIINLIEKSSIELSFVEIGIINHPSIQQYLKEERYLPYRYAIHQILRGKDHTLSKEQEALLSKVDSISNLSNQVFDALRLEYPPVFINGRKEHLDAATLTKFLKHPNQQVRKNAYQNFFGEYKNFENVFSQTLAGVMKKDAFYSDVRFFHSPLQASVFQDDVPESLFFKVLTHANGTYRSLFHQYNDLKKSFLGLQTIYNYDLSVPLVAPVYENYSIDDAFALLNQALKPLGSEYLKIIKMAREQRWIDYFPKPGKRIGAYSSGSYDTYPFILLNYIGDYSSVSTLCHELGHSVHSYLSNKHQDYTNSSYRIFVAEVASTVNETLLINYMIDHARNDHEKAYYLYEQLENCVGLLFRQPMFAQFEHELHELAKEKKPLSSSVITSLYTKLNQEYYGDKVTLDPTIGYSCYYVPHFYYNYYVYKYSIGMTVALAICCRIQQNDQEQLKNYINFLQSGGSASPLDLLKKAGVDPLDDKIYHDAFQYFASLLEQFKEIMQKK